MTANGRQTSDNALFDYGSSINSPGRAIRITERLSDLVNSGKKVTLDDMNSIKDDVVDVFARK